MHGSVEPTPGIGTELAQLTGGAPGALLHRRGRHRSDTPFEHYKGLPSITRDCPAPPFYIHKGFAYIPLNITKNGRNGGLGGRHLQACGATGGTDANPPPAPAPCRPRPAPLPGGQKHSELSTPIARYGVRLTRAQAPAESGGMYGPTVHAQNDRN